MTRIESLSRDSHMGRVMMLVALSLFISAMGTSVNANQRPDPRFSFSLTYESFKELERDSPELAFAYLKGMSEAIFTFRVISQDVFLYCTPEPTQIDPELIKLVATNEVRLHGAETSEYFMVLVKRGMFRAFPRTPENCD